VIYRLELLLRTLARWLSRSEWAVRLLGLAKSEEPPAAAGLVIIQIDGLSHTQLGRALERGRMPFLRRLLEREGYRLHVMYSGVPSTTPAVQGELFYGVRQAVPAFRYLHRKSREIRVMYEPAAASAVEADLAKAGAPLLAGGSSYCDIYTGGADEAHFCPSSFGWDAVLRAANPLALAFLFLTNAFAFLRAGALLVVEVVLALTDVVRGLIGGHELAHELAFVPSRVVVCVLLRELMTIGAKLDLARGLPVVHLNFLGYDEQAHRRGPGSAFAHWSLKGIDDAVARIWRAAKGSARRDYDVWIYSDHGQESVVPYAKQHGRTIEEAVAEIFEGPTDEAAEAEAPSGAGEQARRARLLGGKRIQRLIVTAPEPEAPEARGRVTVVAPGPLGFVYLPEGAAAGPRDGLARALATKAKVPLVLAKDGAGTARAWTEDGAFTLPKDARAILGADHPFLEDAARELVALCRHADAGDFILCGWRAGAAACTFPAENGAHAGAGPEETKAFALLPADAALPERPHDQLRPADLRAAAFAELGGTATSMARPPGRAAGDGGTLKVMTYNVHSCIGMDGRHSPERIARVIARQAPDIVALQELDVGRARTRGIDQARRIAQHLEMDVHFHPAIHVEEEQYGNAVLTHLPMRPVRAGRLPGLPRRPQHEPRGAQWVTIEANGTEIQVINTHLGLSRQERVAQAAALLGPDWLDHPDCRGLVILAGDFNATAASPICRRLAGRLRDSQAGLDGHRPAKTYFGRYPLARIDHVFVDPATEVVGVEVPTTKLARVASDHLPLVVTLALGRDR